MKHKSNCFILTLFLVVVISSSAHAEERVNLEGTTIIGNQDLPKVLYVVPWKQPARSKLITNPIQPRTGMDLPRLDRQDVLRKIQPDILNSYIKQ